MKSSIKILFIFTLLVISFGVYAQPGSGGGGTPADPGTAPISGIEILLVAGGVLGIRKLRQDKKAKS